jgi:DHA1 family bicyclomycin/chloramphenicol resistance-like MFS transporter
VTIVPTNHTPATTPQIEAFKQSPVFLFVLVGLLALQPMSTDFYLPALPSIGRAFNAPTVTVTWTLSALVGTFGLAQLFVGPLTDRFGRRPIAIAGLALYTLASLVAMIVPVIEGLILCRAVQGLSLACAYVVSRSFVRDLYIPIEGAKVLSRGLMIMGLVPLLGPFVGGALDTYFGWQGPFFALAVFSGFVLIFVWRFFPETNQRLNPTATQIKPLLTNYHAILRHPIFLSYTAMSVFSYGGLFAFLSGSSFVFINIFGLSRTVYGLAFGCTGLGYLLGTRACRYLVARRGLIGTVRLAGMLSLTAASIMLILMLLKVHHPLATLLPAVAYVFAHGIQQPCTTTACLGPFPRMAGAASALNGFGQMALAVIVGVWIGKSFDGTVMPLTIIMFIGSVLVAFTGIVLIKRYGQQ